MRAKREGLEVSVDGCRARSTIAFSFAVAAWLLSVMALLPLAAVAGLKAIDPSLSLRPLLLSPGAIGPGYAAAPWSGYSPSSGLKDTASSFPGGCGDYPGEKLRRGYLGAEFKKKGSATTVTEELTSYVPGGARQAMKEVASIMKSCRRFDVDTSGWPGDYLSHSTTYSIRPTAGEGLLSGAIAVAGYQEDELRTGKVEKSWHLSVFHARGDVVSAVSVSAAAESVALSVGFAAGRAAGKALAGNRA